MPNLAPGTDLQSGWDFETPVITFTTPNTNKPTAGTVGFTSGTRVLIFTTGGNLMKQETIHVFEITNVRTPSSIVDAGTGVAMLTQDSKDKDIDTVANAATDQIAVGALVGTPKFETATDTPGFKSVATVTFTTAGQVQAGGKVILVMPDLNTATDLQAKWRFTDTTAAAGVHSAGTNNVPSIAFTTPAANA